MLLAAALALLAAAHDAFESSGNAALNPRGSRKAGAPSKRRLHADTSAFFLVPAFHFYTVSLFERQMIARLSGDVTPRLRRSCRGGRVSYGGQACDTAGTWSRGLPTGRRGRACGAARRFS
jgi:hypothetical protein